MGFRRASNIGVLSFERGELSLTERSTGVDEPVVHRPGVPVELVDGPGNDGWLDQGAHAPGLLARERLGEGVPCGRELA